MPVASPTSASFSERAAQIAIDEWNFFGNQTKDLSGATTHQGHKEDEARNPPGQQDWYKRVAQYWIEGTNTHGITGRDTDSPWSAAFISWVMKTAGAKDGFRYSTQHSVYVSQAIRDKANSRADAGYWGYRLQEKKPQIGDLVCWGREAGVDYDHQKGGDYKGHCDLIVAVSANEVEIVGGNVGNSVTRRPLALDASGFLSPVNQGGENLFALMKCRIA